MAIYLHWIVGALALSLAEAGEIHLSIAKQGPGAYKVEGAFLTDATVETAWETLTDYERIGEFVSSIRKSQILEREEGSILIEQEALGRTFIFSKRMNVLLRVREEASRQILFEDVSLKDFEIYKGSWTLEKTDEGVWVHYELTARPAFLVPSYIANKAFKKNAAKLLREIQTEIVKRSLRRSTP